MTTIRLVVGVLVLALGLLLLNEHTERKAAEQAATFAKAQSDANAKSLQVEKDNRAEDQRRYNAQSQIVAAGRRELDAAHADASIAADAAISLRKQFDSAVARAKRSASHPAVAASSPSTYDSPVVLADLFEKLSGRAKRLAERSTQFSDLADQRGVAGSICERSYDVLRAARAASSP